jgi:TnpA family transposase
VSDWAKRYLGWDHFPAMLEALEIEEFFTLDAGELAAIQSHRGELSRLAVAIQIGYMRMTGMALNSVEMIPTAVLAHIACQLEQSAPQLTSIRALYRRRRTLHDHQEAARQVLGLRALGEHARRKLKAHLRKIVPGQVNLRELVREARRWLDHNRYMQIAERTLHALAREVRREFEAGLLSRLTPLLANIPAHDWAHRLAEEREGITRLEWLRTGLRSKKPHGIEDHLTKIRFLKELGAQQLDLGLPEAVLVALSLPISTRKTARLGRLSSANMLALACFVRLTFLRLNDQGLTMLDHRIADLWRQARTRAEASDALALRRLRHLPLDLTVLGRDESLGDDAFRRAALEMLEPFIADPSLAPPSRVAAVRAELAAQELQVTETLAALAEFDLDTTGNPNLSVAINTLEKTAGKLAADTGNPFGTTWRDLLASPDRKAALGAFKAATLLLVKRSLRNGQAFCGGSFDYRAPADRLIPAQLWHRDSRLLSRSLSLSSGPERMLAAIKAQLGVSLDALAAAVNSGELRITNNHLVVPRIKADPEQPEVAVLRRQLFARIGSIQLADVMIEADSTAQFSRTLLGRAPHGETELALLYAAILALGSDMTAADMARMAPPLSAEAIGVMMRRIITQKRFRAANDSILAAFARLPAARLWGDGLSASSDMMSLETSRRLWAARHDPRRRTPSVGTYTHVLDQWPILYDRPILLNRRQAGAAIEGALHRAELERVAVDTHGFTHFAMAVAKAVGLDLCPRLADLGERKLYLPRGFVVPEVLAPIARPCVSARTIARGYDGFLHVAASVRHDWCPADWAIERFGAAATGAAIHQTGEAIGKLLRTIYLADYLSNPEFRRTIHALLAQGEAVHQLQRAIHDGQIGGTHGRTDEELTAISGALTLLTNLVIFWNASKINSIVAAQPDRYPAEHLAHIAPIAHAHINMRGIIQFRLDRHRAALLDRPSQAPVRGQNGLPT